MGGGRRVDIPRRDESDRPRRADVRRRPGRRPQVRVRHGRGRRRAAAPLLAPRDAPGADGRAARVARGRQVARGLRALAPGRRRHDRAGVGLQHQALHAPGPQARGRRGPRVRAAARIFFRRIAAPPRPRCGYSMEPSRGRRGRDVEIPPTSRGAAAAATWIFCGDESRRDDAGKSDAAKIGDESRRRRGREPNIRRGRVAAPPRARRGHSAETSRGGPPRGRPARAIGTAAGRRRSCRASRST